MAKPAAIERITHEEFLRREAASTVKDHSPDAGVACPPRDPRETVVVRGASAHLPSVGVDPPRDELCENAVFEEGA